MIKPRHTWPLVIAATLTCAACVSNPSAPCSWVTRSPLCRASLVAAPGDARWSQLAALFLMAPAAVAGGVVSFGRVNAATAGACTGGW